MNGSGAASSSAASAYGYGSTSAHTPWWASVPQRAVISPAAATSSRAPENPSFAVASVAQMRRTRRRPRSASRTALRP